MCLDSICEVNVIRSHRLRADESEMVVIRTRWTAESANGDDLCTEAAYSVFFAGKSDGTR